MPFGESHGAWRETSPGRSSTALTNAIYAEAPQGRGKVSSSFEPSEGIASSSFRAALCPVKESPLLLFLPSSLFCSSLHRRTLVAVHISKNFTENIGARALGIWQWRILSNPLWSIFSNLKMHICSSCKHLDCSYNIFYNCKIFQLHLYILTYLFS